MLANRKIVMPSKYLSVCIILISFVIMGCSTSPTPKSGSLENEEGYVRQSMQYLQAGKLDAALASTGRAIQLNPKSADAYTVAGIIYTRNNQLKLAERYFKRALSLEPDHSAAQTNYANFLCKHDKPRDAEKLFIAAAKNDNNQQPDVAYTNAGLCVLGIPDVSQANTYFTKALRIQPRSPVALYQLAKIQYGNYEYDTAFRFLQEYEKIASPTPKTLLLGAQISEALKRPQMASQYKLYLAQQFPNSQEAKIFTKTQGSTQQPALYDARSLDIDGSAY